MNLPKSVCIVTDYQFVENVSSSQFSNKTMKTSIGVFEEANLFKGCGRLTEGDKINS